MAEIVWNPGFKDPAKNQWRGHEDGYLIVKLTQGQEMLLDEVDIGLLHNKYWCATRDVGGNIWYSKTMVGRTLTGIHRFIMDLLGDDDNVADHINGDGLNNRRDD